MSTKANPVPVTTPPVVVDSDKYAIPGQDDDQKEKDERNLNRWHNFESQYSLAVEQSAVIEREAWGSQCEFLMTCIASAVGLGNIWRFPFICGKNGGGAFFIPYLVVLTIVGRPLYMLELGLGQFTSNGPVKIWEMCPAFRGVGYGATLASFFVGTFYCVIMGWSILYFIYSFKTPFPWNNETSQFPLMDRIEIHNSTGAFFGLQHLGDPGKGNLSDFGQSKGLDGPPLLHLSLSLLAAWFAVWLQMVIGVSGSGKVAYFTALFPYVVLSILLFTGASLPHSVNGFLFFVTPNVTEAFQPQAWFQAVAQCFFSLGIGFGGCVTFASFNKFHHKLGKDIIIISIMDTFTSFLAGSCLFLLIGNIAGRDFSPGHDKVKGIVGDEGGAGMAFVVFPRVLEKLPDGYAHFLCALFFLMIIVLAVGSANGLVGTVVTVIGDAFPKIKRPIIVTSVCIFSYFLGLIYVTPSGANIIDLVDRYGSELVIYMMGVFETIGIAYVYGLKNISNDFEFMLGGRISLYWVFSWGILPLILIGIFIFYLSGFKIIENHPTVATVMGWLVTAASWLILPATFIWVVQTRKSHSCVKRFKASFFPTRKWGPNDPAIREAWRRWKRTRPIEFLITHRILVALRLRPNQPMTDPQAYWTTVNESQYQTKDPSAAASAELIGGSTMDASNGDMPGSPQMAVQPPPPTT